MSQPDSDRKPPLKVFIEVTDTLSIGYTTGIQRVVRGLSLGYGAQMAMASRLSRSQALDAERLSNAHRRRRQTPSGPPTGRARRQTCRQLRPVRADRPAGRRRSARDRHQGAAGEIRKKRREFHRQNAAMAVGPMGAGSVFLDIEGSWFDPEPRAELLPRLRSEGVVPMVLVHDVMPIIHPEWFDPRQITVFEKWLTAHLNNSVGFLANSQCTADDLRSVPHKGA